MDYVPLMSSIGPRQGRRVLVVDDDVALCGMLCQILEYDFDSRSTHSCSEALSLMHQWLADVAVVDYNLPDGTGLTLLPQLYELNPKLLSVLISGDLGKAQADPQCQQVKIHRMLAKPLTIKLFRDTVREVLAMNQERAWTS